MKSWFSNSDLSISYSCSFICLKRIPRFFVVWHGKSSVEIILSELIIPFFDRFSRTKSANKNTQNSEMNSACFCLHSQSANLDGFSKHPYENLPFTEFFFKTFDPFPQRSPLFAAALGVPVGLVGRAYLILQWDI